MTTNDFATQVQTETPVPGTPVDSLYDVLSRNRWAGGNILRGELPVYPTVAALPTATADYRYRTVIVAGAAGVADKLYTCLKSASDTYSWVQTGVAMVAGSSTSDLKDDLVANGIVADSGATPLNLDGGALTAGATSVTTLAASSTLNVTGTTTLGTTNTGTINAGQINFTGDIDGSATSDLYCRHGNIEGILRHTGSSLQFFNVGSDQTKKTITGSRGGNAALASLLTQGAAYGLWTDSTTA